MSKHYKYTEISYRRIVFSTIIVAIVVFVLSVLTVSFAINSSDSITDIINKCKYHDAYLVHPIN